jgi:ScaI restriction endonuclease
MSSSSPYKGVPRKNWLVKTEELVDAHPPVREEIVDAVLVSWQSLFDSRIGRHGIQIGKDIFPSPQMMGAFLHELLPLELAARHPGVWRGDQIKAEKDLVYIPDPTLSVEVKTSSHKNQIFANRSYAQPGGDVSPARKGKSGYYIAVNFEKFAADASKKATFPRIRLIRFGWLEHTDWIAQKAGTGQQARLNPKTYALKFVVLFDLSDNDG